MDRKSNGLGKSLIRDYKKKHIVNKDGFRHTTDLHDGFDWARLNLRSVTEQTSVEDFLDKVDVAEKEYTKEFSNIKILAKDEVAGIITEEEKITVVAAQEKHKHVLSIPRRPPWNSSMTKEELESNEREEFLNWRRKLALLKEEKHINLTPYEKNLEIWRQLWRVIEKSDVVVQIADARNPLLFRCEDLEVYAKELGNQKHNVLLLNKADFLSDKQREMWASYFESIGVKVVFFSALQQSQMNMEDISKDTSVHTNGKTGDHIDTAVQANLEGKSKLCDSIHQENEIANNNVAVRNSSEVLSKSELVAFLKTFRKTVDLNSNTIVVGMVGYPNVGKSSTINALLSSKKVQVSATPGKTKHFQTIIIDSQLCLCDCPGLVFPNFISTKADMVINGILPIDQMTEHIAPVTLVTNLIPRSVLESTYSIMIPPPPESNESSRPPTAEEFLNAYGYMRGFMTQRGLPDTARSARYVLKDFLSGKLLYCHPPPVVSGDEYQGHSVRLVADVLPRVTAQASAMQKPRFTSDEIDRNFFKMASGQAHVKGITLVSGYSKSSQSESSSSAKPWKKHHNRNKKEKLRRIYHTAD